jgi:hypothetical protein
VTVTTTPPPPDTRAGFTDSIVGRGTIANAPRDSPIAKAFAASAPETESDSLDRDDSYSASADRAVGGPAVPHAHATRTARVSDIHGGGASAHLETADDTRSIFVAKDDPKRHQHSSWRTSWP